MPIANADEQQPITGFFQAVQQASRCDPQRDGNNSAADRPRFYAFDEASKRALNNGQPSETREAALEDLDVAERERAQVVEVPEGILVVRDQKVRADAPDPDRFWVVQDNPALSGTDIRNPEQDFDEQFGNEPNVRFEFTDRGREAFQEITRAIAQRGRDNAFRAPGPAAFRDRARRRARLGALDRLRRVPGRDRRLARAPQISGGLHDPDSAQDLARLLKIGALPLRLELISRSQVSASLGRQALDQGLLAGLAGFAIVALFLLVFYRVLGADRGRSRSGIYALYLSPDQADPDHADAAGDRRADPHARRRGGRQHRDLRARQGGDPRTAAVDLGRHRRRLSRRASRRSWTRTSSRCSSRSSSSSSRPRACKGFALRARGRRDRVAVHRRARDAGDPATRCAARGCCGRASALGAGKPRKPIRFDFIGELAVVLLDVGRDPADLRAGDRLQGAELRDRLRVGHAHHRAARAAGDGRPGPRRGGAARASATPRIQTVDNRELGSNVVQIIGRGAPAGRVDRVDDTLRDRVRVRGDPRSQIDRRRASARPWPELGR